MSSLVESLEKEILRYIGSEPKNELAYDYGYIHGLRKAKEIAAQHLLALDGLYCQFCGELLSEHLITEKGGHCETARK